MSRTWTFSDVEFVSLWEGVTKEFLPPPLTFSSLTPRYDDYVREMFETRKQLRTTLDPNFDIALHAISQPDIRICAQGWDGLDPENPKRCVRVLGTLQGQRGYVTRQIPGETIWHSAGFTVTECDVLGLSAAVVNCLPDVGAGRRGDIVLPVPCEDMDYRYGRSSVVRSIDDTSDSRSDTFLREPASSIGTIAVVQGRSLYGPRGITEHTIAWRDIIDDGRYAIPPGNPPTAYGVDTKRLTETINVCVAEVVRMIEDELA
ncbi:ESX secretion-associated protein EspG [Nocardia sp. NPDC049220]|uniref:ESX secretion-associated protein EspG n=1 Tax=Nocardia sp. NPDC049220 TaxID=3155273 RepID=UPI0033E01CA4